MKKTYIYPEVYACVSNVEEIMIGALSMEDPTINPAPRKGDLLYDDLSIDEPDQDEPQTWDNLSDVNSLH